MTLPLLPESAIKWVVTAATIIGLSFASGAIHSIFVQADQNSKDIVIMNTRISRTDGYMEGYLKTRDAAIDQRLLNIESQLRELNERKSK